MSSNNNVKNASGMVNDKLKKKRIPSDVFIKTFQTSDSYKEVADKLNLTISCVYSRAKNYKTKGINLKKMPHQSRNNIDIEEANKLISELESSS